MAKVPIRKPRNKSMWTTLMFPETAQELFTFTDNWGNQRVYKSKCTSTQTRTDLFQDCNYAFVKCPQNLFPPHFWAARQRKDQAAQRRQTRSKSQGIELDPAACFWCLIKKKDQRIKGRAGQEVMEKRQKQTLQRQGRSKCRRRSVWERLGQVKLREGIYRVSEW